MDEWMEEDEPVYTHARDPHHRVDILASRRQVRVEVDGVTLAESRSSMASVRDRAAGRGGTCR